MCADLIAAGSDDAKPEDPDMCEAIPDVHVCALHCAERWVGLCGVLPAVPDAGNRLVRRELILGKASGHPRIVAAL